MIGEVISSKTYSGTSKRSGNHKQRYVYRPRDWSTLTCTIRGPEYPSNECTVLSEFGYEYTKDRPTK